MKLADRSISTARLAAAMLAFTAVFLCFIGMSANDAIAKKPKCTIKGTKGPDKLVGTKKRDVICGFGGRDRIRGLGGKDLLIGGKGNDLIAGGSGADRLVGGAGDDRLLGQPQNDRLFGGPGDDLLDGGGGSNHYYPGPGQDRCLAGAADTLAGTCDNTPPELVSFSIDPGSVDSSAAQVDVRVTARVKDDLSGMRNDSISLTADHAATGQKAWGSLGLVSGHDKDGVYKGTFRLAQYSAPGRWTVSMSLSDRSGNGASFGPDQLAALGFASGFDQTGPGDVEKPQIRSFTLDRNSINTTASDQTVKVRVRVTDDFTGVTLDQMNAVGIVASHTTSSNQSMADMRRVSGTDTDGIYEGELHFRRYSFQGTWDLRVGAIDRAGNMTLHSWDELKRMGLPHTITQTGIGDSQPPQISGISVSPKTIDTTTGPRTVTYRYRVTDNLSGNSGDSGYMQLIVNGVTSPHQVRLERISGDNLDGIYEGSVELPQGSVQGTWTANPHANDLAGNVTYYDQPKLATLGFPTNFVNGP